MANNINRIFDEYSQEDYLCHKLRPRGQLLCGYCDEVYEPYTYETEEAGDFPTMTVCKHCGEVSFPYEED